MSQYVVTDTELTAVANAIRTKGGTQANLKWYQDYVDAIAAISGGGGGSDTGYRPPDPNSGTDGDIYIQIAKGGILASSGNCYIDTQIKPTAKYGFFVEFCMQSTTSNYDTVFGTRNGSNGRFTSRFDSSTTGLLFNHISRSANGPYISFNTEILKNSAVNNYVKLNFQSNYANTNDDEFPYSIYLFANNNAGSPSDYANIKVKEFMLLDGDRKCVLYLVPASNNGIACMYDLISGNYFTNSGTGSFTYTDSETEKYAVIWNKINGSWIPHSVNG